MKAGFVIPGDQHNFKPFKNTPLGALYLLTILEQHFGSKLELSLTDLRGISEENRIYHIPEKDVFLYSTTSPELPQTERLVKELRKVYPKAKHIAGGHHINLFQDDSLQIFDAIALGEGEETIKEIIADVSNFKLKGVYSQKGEVNLDNYPHPSRKYMPKKAVVDTELLCGEYSNLRGASVMFSRGCPFNCHFCSILTHGPVRVRSPHLIKEEIEYLKKDYGVEGLVLKDDQAIPTNSAVAQSMLEAIAGTNVKWRGQSRANGIHPDMVKLAKKSGCVEIAVGIESVDEKVLGIINKKIDLDEAKEYMNLLKENDIGVKLLLMMGLPGEPKDIAKRTIDYIRDVNPSSVLLSLFCPMPGSEIYRNPKRFGIRIDNHYSFDKYFTSFGRFDDKERPYLVFEYDKATPFGWGMKKEEISRNYVEVQSFLRESKLNF